MLGGVCGEGKGGVAVVVGDFSWTEFGSCGGARLGAGQVLRFPFFIFDVINVNQPLQLDSSGCSTRKTRCMTCDGGIKFWG